MIQVLHRAFDIIDFVSQNPDKPKLLGEISAAIDLKPGTCANIVKTLTNRGYLEKMVSQKGYLPGKQLFLLSGNNGYKKELIEAADQIMETLTNHLTENSLLAVMNGDMRNVIHTKLSKQLVQANTPNEKKAYDSSTGRLLIAMLPDSELDKFIARFGLPTKPFWQDANSKKKFHSQIDQIRKNGYAMAEDSLHIVGFAAPIYKKNKLIAGLSIYMPAFRCTEKIKAKMIKSGLLAAKKISENLS